MALHQFANDFFSLLGGSKDEDELEGVLRTEWETRCNKADDVSVPNWLSVPSNRSHILGTYSTFVPGG